MPITVTIVEDDSEIRQNLALLIDQSPGLRYLSSYGTAEEAIKHVPKDSPDVVLMDIGLPRMSGVECVWRIKEACPNTQVLMHTVYEDSEQIFQSLRAGASGYLLKRASKEELVRAIEEVRQGGAPMTTAIARKVVQYFHHSPSSTSTEQLSERERQVLELLARGSMYKEIADALHISLDTVRKHIQSIYGKLHVRSRTEAVVKYLEHGPSR